MTGTARGRTVLVVEHEDHAGLGRLRPPLQAAAHLDVRRPYLGDRLVGGLEGFDGLVVLGGSMGAHDDALAPWLPGTRALLAEAVRAEVPALGLCLGAQLLAVATGGRVERGTDGLEVGAVPVAATAAGRVDPVTAAVADRPVAQWHEDAVTVLPPGAALLATGARYPHQAFRLGARAWGLQWHPEVTQADFAAWTADGHDSLTAAGLDPDDVLAGVAAAEEGLQQVADGVARAFAAALRGT